MTTKTTTRKTSTQELATRLILLISTLVFMVVATAISVKICYSQYRMFSYYVDIQRAEDCRDYNESLSNSYRGPYMEFAASYDDEVQNLLKQRSAYISEADDPIIQWSIRDGFDLLTAIVGIGGVCLLLKFWIKLLYHMTKVIDTELWIIHLLFCKIMRRKCNGCCRRCPRNR